MNGPELRVAPSAVAEVVLQLVTALELLPMSSRAEALSVAANLALPPPPMPSMPLGSPCYRPHLGDDDTLLPDRPYPNRRAWWRRS